VIRAIRTTLWFVVLTLALVVAAKWLPRQLNRVQVPGGFEDQGGFVPMTGVWLEPPPYAAGDMVAYRTGDGPEDVGFGVVAALPGDQVRMIGGELLVDDNEVRGWRDVGLYRGIADIGPLCIPVGHLYVLSTQHQRDSLVLGAIGPDQLLGKVRE
jgi:hypothetical protein